MTSRPRLLSLFLAFFLAHSLAAQDWNELRQVVREELAAMKAPGAAIAVIQDNKVVFAEGFGFANLAANVPVTPQTRFRIGSLAKMFTAAAILSEPRLKLDVPVRTYVPDLPPRIGEATLDQLLSHQAGLVDRLNEVKLSEDDLVTSPGRFFSYSSLGYSIAGRAASSVTGVPFDEFLGRTFAQYGMSATSFEAGALDAVGYRKKKERAVKTEYLQKPDYHPAGFLHSNLEDLSKFAIAFMSGELTVAQEMAKTRATVINDARRYGYGAMLIEEGGELAVFHNGDEPGGSSMLKMYPAKKAAVIVLTNLMGRLPKSTATALRLASGVTVPEPEKEPYEPIKRADARRLAGFYQNYTGIVVKPKGIIKPALPWFAAWLPFSRKLVSFGGDQFGIAGTTLGPEPLKFTAVRGDNGEVEFLFLQGRLFKKKA